MGRPGTENGEILRPAGGPQNDNTKHVLPAAQQPPKTCLALVGAVAVLAVLLAGCRPAVRRQVNAWWHPSLLTHPPPRVVLLPLGNETDCPGIEEGLTEELLRTFQQRRLFLLGLGPQPPVGDTDLPAGRQAGLPAPGKRQFTTQELAAIRRAFGADAVLAGVVSHAQPFPRMQIGLHLRLRDLRNGRLLGQVDHVFDTTTEHTQQRIAEFFRREVGTGSAPFDWQLGTVSPRAFQQFVAWEVAGTLPNRVPQPSGPDTSLRASRDFRKNPGW
ncbi:MAG: hypothetical protein AMS14_05965 [Planctomycetes bacterium DG_20]|nr:MAG: hypothetical protein AMS14_05965 [Planctomycetes bacterium DG_20]